MWEIGKRLQDDGARPAIYHGRGTTCRQPAVKGLNLAVNTIYSH